MGKATAQSIAGMSLGGGRKENFFFCLLEFFEDKNRWFLTSLKQVKDEEKLDSDDVITHWVEDYKIKKLIVDFPLSKPVCESCNLECPGAHQCHHPVVQNVRGQIDELVEEDKKQLGQNPKRYEQQRNEDDLIEHSRSVLDKETHEHILSRSFKRKLKKGFLPYWNRPVDFWLWKHYYDQILETFNVSYDSYGNVSVMLMNRFHYLLRHLPSDLSLHESNTYITLLELYRAGVISRKNLLELQDIHLAPLARVMVAKQIEKHLNVFIYEGDLELLAKNPKAFDSFLLAICGQALIYERTIEVSEFGEKNSAKFVVPDFC